MDHPIAVSFVRWIILLPAIGAAINFFLGPWLQKNLGKRAISVVGCGVVIAWWLDPLSMIMTLIITGVGGLIHIYSTGYMHDDEAYWRFFGWLNLFTFAMLVLVLGDNLWLMFVG